MNRNLLVSLFLFVLVSCQRYLEYNPNGVYLILEDGIQGDTCFQTYFERKTLIDYASKFYKDDECEDEVMHALRSLKKTELLAIDKQYIITSKMDSCLKTDLIRARMATVDMSFRMFKDKAVLVFDKKAGKFIPYKMTDITKCGEKGGAFVRTKDNRIVFSCPSWIIHEVW